MIHNILTGLSLKLKCSTHEPYLHYGDFDNKPRFLLTPADEFIVTDPRNIIRSKFFALIQNKLKNPLILLVVLTMFNGLNTTQGEKYIKLSYKTYISKILEGCNCSNPTYISLLST